MSNHVARKIALRRYPNLREDQVVHHIDGNPNNNDPNNLLIMDRKEHSEFHAKFRAKNKKGRGLAKKIAVVLYKDQVQQIKQLSKFEERPFSTQLRMVIDEGLRVMKIGTDEYLNPSPRS